ncbi:MAG: Ig-like domain-containing protein, partial [Limisphaerales bacterium]
MKMTPSFRAASLAWASVLGAFAAQAAAPASPQGLISAKAFLNIQGTTVATLTGNAKFPDSPDVIQYPEYFEWNATGDIGTPAANWADNYGTQIIGYFYPPATGTYIFYLSADDNASLYLSTDATPENKKLIAQETVWSNPREYFTSGGNSVLASKDSSQFTGTQWPTTEPGAGAVITLQANQPYYIEAIAKEGGGGDNLSVAVGDSNGTMDSSVPILGQYLSSDRSNGPVSITRQPANKSIGERGSVTFNVTADGTPPHTFQWRRNGEVIADATGASYTVSGVAVADDKAVFSVEVTGAQGTATSSDAVLTVLPDTVQPALLSAKGRASLTEVVLIFSEGLDPTSAGTTANYQIASSGGSLAVTSATLSPDGTAVTLGTANQVLGTKYTVRVSNVKDIAATPNTIVAESKAVFFPMGKLVESADGFIVFEAENYDRNLDGIWVADTTRGTPSGGVSMVSPNGAGGSEGATKLEYDVEFKKAGTYQVWYRASGDNGNDDSSWFHLNGARPEERATGNQASMTGFQPQADFVWRSDAQDAPDPFTVEIPSAGLHVVGLARREDGSFHDKFILTTDLTYTPTGFGPPETREGVPAAPTVALTAPTANQKFTPGTPIVLTATGSGDKGLEIARMEFLANGSVVGESTSSPFTYSWSGAPEGLYSMQARAIDEIGGVALSDTVLIEVASAPSGSSARIAWVSFHPADDTPSAAALAAGFTKAPDVAYTDLLTANGHKVTRVVTSGTPDTALLNAFDLVIISRSVPSGDYQDPPETLAWNGITTPTLILGGYILRNSRLGFTTGGTIPDTIGPIH